MAGDKIGAWLPGDKNTTVKISKKFGIRETNNLSTDADSSTAAKELLSILLFYPSPSPPPPRGF